MTYPVTLTKTEEGYSISCPALPGCWSQGKTEEQALANIAEAIQDYLAVAATLHHHPHSAPPTKGNPPPARSSQ